MRSAISSVRSLEAFCSKAGFVDFSMYASNSPRNFVMPEITGAIAASEKTQIVMPLPIWFEIWRRRSRSVFFPSPFTMRLSILSSQGVPSRQGVHWPQDSCA